MFPSCTNKTYLQNTYINPADRDGMLQPPEITADLIQTVSSTDILTLDPAAAFLNRSRNFKGPQRITIMTQSDGLDVISLRGYPVDLSLLA